ncbi:hypothetical protein CR513_45096, partial [Mucuna pruriens]
MVQVEDTNQKFFVKAFQKGLRTDPFSDSLVVSQLTNTAEIKACTEKHVEIEEDKEDRLLEEKAMPVVKRKITHEFYTHQQYNPRRLRQHDPCVEKYTPLRMSRAHILKEVYHLQLLDIPPPMQHQLGPSHDEWCEFHRATSHLMGECRQLKSEIEKLIYEDPSETNRSKLSRAHKDLPKTSRLRLARAHKDPSETSQSRLSGTHKDPQKISRSRLSRAHKDSSETSCRDCPRHIKTRWRQVGRDYPRHTKTHKRQVGRDCLRHIKTHKRQVGRDCLRHIKTHRDKLVETIQGT